jgi:hypothetical protein
MIRIVIVEIFFGAGCLAIVRWMIGILIIQIAICGGSLAAARDIVF